MPCPRSPNVPFFAGSLFPISALPAGLTVIGNLLPITHVLAPRALRARR
jgi:hypothetical protein